MKTIQRLFVSCCLLAAAAPGQSRPTASRPAAPDSGPTAQAIPTQKIRWPGDRKRAICKVNGQEYTVDDLVDHLESDHFPRLRAHLKTATGKALFDNPIVARWVRQFADIVALRNEATYRGIDAATARVTLEATLKEGFESYLQRYLQNRAKEGRGDEQLTQTTIDNLLARFQNFFGLENEVEGWLSVLVDEPTAKQSELLLDYYHEHVRFFGGRVHASVILLRNRDPYTGELYVGPKRQEFLDRKRDLEARLAEDGSNFEEVARLLSEDPVTAKDGGVLRNISRFEPGLPRALSRAVWGIADGAWTGPFESEYGVHYVKRLGYVHQDYYVYTDKLVPRVIGTYVEHQQEKLLFRAREEQRVELLY